MLSNRSHIRVVLAVLTSMAIHAWLLSMNSGVSRSPVAGTIQQKVTVRLVPRRVTPKPVSKILQRPVQKPARQVETPAVLQIPEPVEVVVREVPPVSLPQAPKVPELKSPFALPVEIEVAEPADEEVDIKDSPQVILATPLYRKNPPPEYPSRARRRHLQGTVLLQVTVSREGKVEKMAVHQSSGFNILDRAALQAVKKWLFEPGRKGGERVAMEVLVPVRFSLR